MYIGHREDMLSLGFQCKGDLEAAAQVENNKFLMNVIIIVIYIIINYFLLSKVGEKTIIYIPIPYARPESVIV